MSRLFDRTYSLTITGGSEARTITDLHVSFSAKKSRSDTPNTCNVKIWNPAPNTRNAAIDSQATLELYAGYAGDNVLLSRAEISNAKVDFTLPNVMLDIQASEGVRTLRETTLSISHAGGSSVQTVLDEIEAAVGLPVRPTGVDLSTTLGGGFAHVGRVSTALTNLVARIGGSWSIQNGEIQVLGPEGESLGAEAFLLTPETGLIESPTPKEDQTDSERSSTAERRGYEVKCLLNPRIEPGGLIEVQSREVDGVFVVDAIEHRGDYAGQDWYSVITCQERGA